MALDFLRGSRRQSLRFRIRGRYFLLRDEPRIDCVADHEQRPGHDRGVKENPGNPDENFLAPRVKYSAEQFHVLRLLAADRPLHKVTHEGDLVAVQAQRGYSANGKLPSPSRCLFADLLADDLLL